MVNHVKLEIAIQIVADKIANIYRKINSAKSQEELENLSVELDNAFYEKTLVETGNMSAINSILSANKEGDNK